jgi:hypothetical protein
VTRVDLGWLAAKAWLEELSPASLPEPPWVLAYTPGGQGTHPTGGPFLTVHNNEGFLRALKRDMSRGPNGPRGRAVTEDLKLLYEKVK